MDLPRNISINATQEGLSGRPKETRNDKAPSTATPTSDTRQPEPDFSSAVQILKDPDQAVEWGLSFSTLPPIPHSVSELKQWFDDFATELRSHIEESLQHMEIQLDAPVTLQVNDQGEAQATGADSDLAKLSQLIEQQPAIEGQLQRAASRHKLVQLMDNAQLLQGQNGDSRFSQQQGNSATFSLSIGNRATSA